MGFLTKFKAKWDAAMSPAKPADDVARMVDTPRAQTGPDEAGGPRTDPEPEPPNR